MIKVPATPAGIPAIEELTARGINVNVTLLFSVARYEQVIDAYLARSRTTACAARRADRRDRVGRVVLRLARRRQGRRHAAADSELRGSVAIANAQRAYARYRERFTGARWRRLRDAGARPQRPLWASTGTKDPAYSDVLYVEELIAPDVINTMPEATLRAFADHGEATQRVRSPSRAGEETLRARRGRRRRPRRRSPPSSSARGSAPSASPTATLLDCIEAARPDVRRRHRHF